MPDAEGCGGEVAPSSVDGMDVGSAHATAFVDDVDVVGFEDFGCELDIVSWAGMKSIGGETHLLLLELGPLLGGGDHEACELLWSCCHIGDLVGGYTNSLTLNLCIVNCNFGEVN